MKAWGIARRLYTAHGLLAAAYLLSLGGLLWSLDRRETAVRDSLSLTRYGQSVQAAAVSCRRYLGLVLGGGDAEGVRGAARQALKRLGRGRLDASKAGAADQSRELERLSRFVGASRTLLERIATLDRQGRRDESAALYEGGVRPLMEQYLASGLERSLVSERSERLKSLRRTRLWSQAFLAALGVFAALTFVVFGVWTRSFASYLVRNMERIRRAILAVGSGNFAITLEPERSDEMGALANGLKIMAERLEQAQRRLVESERLAALGQLAGGAAHALNNPLSAIMGYASLLAEKEGLAPADRQDVRVIVEQAQRCDAILRNLRQFASEKGLARERVEVNDVLKRMADLLRHKLASSGVSLSMHAQARLPAVMANSRELQQAFYNLVSNAARAVRGRPDAQILVETRREGSWVCVSVNDNGEGIPPENLPRLFEPFFTTRDPGEGAGLGLSSALAIVKDHGGELRVESRPGQGSRFEARLPVSSTPAGAEASPNGGTGGRILVVDDESNILTLIDRVLTKQGFEVVCLSAAREALEAVARGGYDLILSDYRMPGLDGQDFYEAVKRAQPELARRFIFTTGEIVAKDFQALVERERIPVILKPFDLDELAKTVRERSARGEAAPIK